MAAAGVVAEELVDHLDLATNGGGIRSVITVFAPDHPQSGPRVRIWNELLIRYAGWRIDAVTDHGTDRPAVVLGDSAVLGDPAFVGFTDLVGSLGWAGPPGGGQTGFDVLPWVIETAAQAPVVVPVPAEAVLEVPLAHSGHLWFADLGLRWHAVPVIANMRLRFGGLDFSCAPFNGFYLAAEIATRNLAYPDPYNLLPTVAADLALDLKTDRLWRDKPSWSSTKRCWNPSLPQESSPSTTTPRAPTSRASSSGKKTPTAPSTATGAGLTPTPMTPQDPSWNRYHTLGDPPPNFYPSTTAATIRAGHTPPALHPLAPGARYSRRAHRDEHRREPANMSTDPNHLSPASGIGHRYRDQVRAQCGLTSQQFEILGLIARGLGTSSIANQLCLDVPTVRATVGEAMLHLGLTSQAEAAAWWQAWTLESTPRR